MKIVKMILLLLITSIGIYSFVETGFYNKLNSVNRIEEMQNRRRPPEVRINEQERTENVATDNEAAPIQEQSQVAPAPERRPERRDTRNQNKWKMKLNFERGILVVLMYSSIIVLITTLTYLVEKKLIKTRK